MSSQSQNFRSSQRHGSIGDGKNDQPDRAPPLPTNSPLGFMDDLSYDDEEEAAMLLKPDAAVTSLDVLELEDHEGKYGHLYRRRRRWSRFLAPFSSLWFGGRRKNVEGTVRFLRANEPDLDPIGRLCPKSRPLRWLLLVVVFFFLLLGVVQFIVLACGVVLSFFPDDFDLVLPDRVKQGQPAKGPTQWPTDATKDVLPVGCHSHNDYWRPIPLFSALQAGCTGVEADVWLTDGDLFVGHSRSSLTPNRTLQSLYVNPIVKLLDKQNPLTDSHAQKDQPFNGVFDTDPSQSLVLLIDFKTDGSETWPYVVSQLSPLRDRGYLTYFNGTGISSGAVTVVATGNAPFDLLTANTTYRDIFFDAPLDVFAEEGKRSPGDHGQGHSGTGSVTGPDAYNETNSYYASVSFMKSIGFAWRLHITSSQIDLIRAQIAGAHRHGLKVRYWETPNWPRRLRNHIWTILVREGVDYLNVDDLRSATTQDWKHRFSDWWH